MRHRLRSATQHGKRACAAVSAVPIDEDQFLGSPHLRVKTTRGKVFSVLLAQIAGPLVVNWIYFYAETPKCSLQ